MYRVALKKDKWSQDAIVLEYESSIDVAGLLANLRDSSGMRPVVIITFDKAKEKKDEEGI